MCNFGKNQAEFQVLSELCRCGLRGRGTVRNHTAVTAAPSLLWLQAGVVTAALWGLKAAVTPLVAEAVFRHDFAAFPRGDSYLLCCVSSSVMNAKCPARRTPRPAQRRESVCL